MSLGWWEAARELASGAAPLAANFQPTGCRCRHPYVALLTPTLSQFYSLHNAHPDLPTLFGIVRTNGLPLDDEDNGAIFELGCRFNHSCAPNVHHDWDAKREAIFFHATRAVRKDEELTIFYVRPLDSSVERQFKLRSTIGFSCTCEVCASADVAASDKRRESIKATTETLPSLGATPLRITIKVRQALTSSSTTHGRSPSCTATR